MIRKLLQSLGILKDEAELHRYEPVYGMPKESFEEWIAQNPALREKYAAQLTRVRKHWPVSKEDTNAVYDRQTRFKEESDRRNEVGNGSFGNELARTST